MHAALDAGRPVDTEPTGYAVDALGASQVGEVGFAALRAAAARSVLVTDEDIREARQHLWRIARIAAEPAGATAVAALLSGAYRPDPGERVAAVVCGGNASPADLA
jgi:threonine dehydratase